VHADPVGHLDRAAAGPLGDDAGPVVPVGAVRDLPVGIHPRRAAVRRRLRHRRVRKWHLGAAEGRLPADHGFDEWWGLKNTTDEAGYTAYPGYKQLLKDLLKAELALPLTIGMGAGESPKLWQATKGSTPRQAGDLDMKVRPFLDEMIVKRATRYIKRQASAGRPFFTYIALTHIHPPEGVHPDFDRTSPTRLGTYADIMAEMDHRVGQVLGAIEAAGITDDTIVVLSSDNATGGVAAVQGGSNGPWRGNFFTPPYEGSYRVPAIVRWPGKVPAGRVTNDMIAAVDWMPTLAGLAGESGRVPDDRPIDGLDASTFLTGRRRKSPRRHVMLLGLDGQIMSVKNEFGKVVFRYADGMDKPIVEPMFPQVFDLGSDPGETDNLNYSRMDCTWMLFLAGAVFAKFQESVARYPNIQTGQDFKGYDIPGEAGPGHGGSGDSADLPPHRRQALTLMRSHPACPQGRARTSGVSLTSHAAHPCSAPERPSCQPYGTSATIRRVFARRPRRALITRRSARRPQLRNPFPRDPLCRLGVPGH
jgi:hypothetical protein